MKIQTKDSSGKPNGYLIPVWSALQFPDLRPDQVYVTVIAPQCRKGPHLHKVRRGLFAVISGLVSVRLRTPDGEYLDPSCADLIHVPPGYAAAVYNHGNTEALVINMPSPAWSPEEPDDWPIEDWKDPEVWRNA